MPGELPLDPMWAVFRERHPEVNLILLPPEPPADDLDAVEGADAPPPPPPVSLADAEAAMAALQRRGTLVGEALRCVLHGDSGWQLHSPEAVQPHATMRGPASAESLTAPQDVAARLEALGWDVRVRPDSEITWVEARTEELFARVTVVDGIVNVRLSGEHLRVSEDDASTLTGVAHAE